MSVLFYSNIITIFNFQVFTIIANFGSIKQINELYEEEQNIDDFKHDHISGYVYNYWF